MPKKIIEAHVIIVFYNFVLTRKSSSNSEPSVSTEGGNGQQFAQPRIVAGQFRISFNAIFTRFVKESPPNWDLNISLYLLYPYGTTMNGRKIVYSGHTELPQNQGRSRNFEIVMVLLTIARVIMCVVIIAQRGLEHRMSRVSQGLRLGHTQTRKHIKSQVP